MTIGIYALYWAEQDSQIYVGKSSVSIEQRFVHHCSELKLHTHPNIQLQQYFDLYNVYPTQAILEVISSIDNSIFDTKEIEWIEEFDSFRNGLNRTKGGNSNACGEDSHFSKNSNEKIIKIFLELVNNPEEHQQDIANRLKVSLAVLGSIAKGSRHGWLSTLYPKEYSLLMSRKYSKSGDSVERGLVLPKLVSPEGVVYTVTNQCSFAKAHNLMQPALWRLLNFKADSHKKWRRFSE